MTSSSATSTNSKRLRLRVFWGDILYDTRLLSGSRMLTVGSDQKNDFVMDIGSHTKWRLARTEKRSVQLRLLPGQEGFFENSEHEIIPLRFIDGKKQLALSKEGDRLLTLNSSERAEIVFDNCTFAFDWITPEKALPPTKWFQPVAFASTVFVVFALYTMFYLMHRYTPPLEQKTAERVVTLVRTEPKREVIPPPPPIEEVKVEPKPEVKPEPVPEPKVVAKPKLTKSVVKAPPVKNTQPAPPPNPFAAAEKEEWDDLGSSLSQLSNKSAPPKRAVARAGAEGAVGTQSLGNIAKEERLEVTTGQGTGKVVRGAATESAAHSENGNASATAADREMIQNFVRDRQPRLKTCYDREVARLKESSGYLKVRFTVTAAGRVDKLKVIDDTLHSPNVTRCVLDEVKQWEMPPPQSGKPINIEYPFVFEKH